jgi:DHA1 family bicyclomycin/chloramphenicol resistance-like MFS transporter
MAVIAPVMGGALTAGLGWRSVFGFNALYGLLIIVLCTLTLPETRPAVETLVARPRLFAGFGLLLRDRRFVALSLCNCLNYGALFAWLSGGQFVLIETAQLGPDVAGAYLSLSIIGFILGSALGGRLTARLGNRRKIVSGAVVCFASAATLAGIAAGGIGGVGALVAPAFVFLLGLGFVNPTATAAAIARFPAMAGTASSLVGFIQTLAGAAAVQATGYLYDKTALPMALVMLALCTLALATLPFVRMDAPATR